MEKDPARTIVAMLLEFSGKLDSSARLVKETCLEAEFLAYQKAVGLVMGTIYVDILAPLFAQHRDLEPAFLRDDNP